MERTRMLKLGQKWPGDEPDNTYWIGADPMNSRLHHGDGLVLMGRECRSLAELEMVGSELKAEVDSVLNEARQRFGRLEPSPFDRGDGSPGDGFQTRVVPMRSGRTPK
jgi:hypothetical protein